MEKNEKSAFAAVRDAMNEMAGRISTNRYISAIRDAFAATIPLTIIASVFILINNLLLDPNNGLFKSFGDFTALREIGGQIYNGTMGILGLVVTFLIGFHLAKSFGKNGYLEAVIGLVCFVILNPSTVGAYTAKGGTAMVTGVLTQSNTSATGMFLGIFAALLGVRLFILFSGNQKLKIKMPESVPSGIANSFNGIVPALIVSVIFGTFEVTIRHLSGLSIPDVVAKILQMPLVGGFQSYIGITFYCFLTCLLFFFGVHGPFVLGSVSGPILLTALQQNMEAHAKGAVLPNIVTQPFVDCYVYITMVSLVIALLIGSKKADSRAIAKIGAVPSFFNISEPLIFGVPLVFNPILGIPYVLVPIVSCTLAYTATSLGLVGKTYLTVPWVTPAGLSGYLSTGGDIRASILQILIITAGVFVYLPFVLIANKVKGESQ
ncbi:PTS sugar transporter subunit IIC [Lactovum odontotermitis]